MVEARYYCGVHDAHAGIDWFGGVVENGAEVGDVGESETGYAGGGAVED